MQGCLSELRQTVADFDHPTFKDFTEVTLAQPIVVQGIAMPAGSRGVILAAWADGQAYEVEFETPRHVLLTVEAGCLRA
jgi:hypothetical protein